MYSIFYAPNVVEREISKLPSGIRAKLKSAIDKKLTLDPIAFGKPLRYSLRGARRLRVDDFRVIYKVSESEKKVVIIQIGHRREIYDE
ncbi:MAG: type toxin-antitoxin system RelE/ParE family toxin [Bacteriovoracaceae bacterium]|nr:type toxin-antitoxin system RelE/ParE family toxin [Bacteriovoracaceae bacterium]